MSHKDHIKKLIVYYQRLLQQLKEQQALHGSFPPPYIPLEIENTEKKIEELHAELDNLLNVGVEASRSELSWSPVSSKRRIVWELVERLGIPGVEDLVTGSPYIVGGPIRNPNDFYARRELVARFYEDALRNQVHSLSILGAHRSGNTSFLYYISHPNIIHSYGKRHSFLPVFINLQARITTPRRFYSYLLRAISRSLRMQGGMEVYNVDVPDEIDYRSIYEFFDRACHAGWHFLLLLDEFEILTKNDTFDEDFFGGLRALATDWPIAWVTASFRGIDELLVKKVGSDSPFFNIFHPVPLYLGKLSDAEAQELIVKPASKVGHSFTDDDVEFILKLAGRFPFAIQTASDILYRAYCSAMISKYAKEHTFQIFSTSMEKHFRDHWIFFNPNERHALWSLVHGNSLNVEDGLLRDLVNYGFVEKEGDGCYHVLGVFLSNEKRVTF